MAVYNNVTELIGKTPILKLNNFAKAEGVDANILQSLNTSTPQALLKTELQTQ